MRGLHDLVKKLNCKISVKNLFKFKMQLKNAVLAAQFVNFCYYISIWLQNNCNNNYYAYIYLISHTKPYHDFGFVSINHAALRHASLYSV